MNKPYKEIKDLLKPTVEKATVLILGVCFSLTSVSSEAAVDCSERSFQNVEDVEEAASVTASYETVEFELSDNQDKWQTALDELAEYPDNWDGEGSRAIKPATITNCRSLLNDTYKYRTILDDIFPTELGTVCIQWYDKQTDALINAEIAPDRIAFYADVPGKDFNDFKPAPYGKESIDKLLAVLGSLS